jgi:hypothetical protein
VPRALVKRKKAKGYRVLSAIRLELDLTFRGRLPRRDRDREGREPEREVVVGGSSKATGSGGEVSWQWREVDSIVLR